jgi:hypothetical protein
MPLENRQSERRPFGYRGWIKIYISGVESLVPCTIKDTSKGGARLAFRSAYDIPDSFPLHLSKTALTSKLCRVVWRMRDAIGVEFL